MSPAARAAEECAAALEAAAYLLALAMRESHGPVEVLGGALERMAATLGQCARVLDRQRAAEGPQSAQPKEAALREVAAAHAMLERDIALCIESLQFHDRLMQRLERVSRCLADHSGEHRASADRLCGAVAAEGSIELFE